MKFGTRSYEKELLDRNDIPFHDIEQNMRELDFINTWLGGHDITIAGLKKLLREKKRISVCEIGCGGGDNLYALIKWCNKRDIAISVTGVDINADCIAVARARLEGEDMKLIVSDYKLVDFTDNKPDIIFSSLFCHHFNEKELDYMLQWMKRNAAEGFFINDLHRHGIAYYSIKWLTRLFSKSYLVKNDAPLSVRRGFRRPEWEQLLNNAGIYHYSLKWKWAFRWLLVVGR